MTSLILLKTKLLCGRLGGREWGGGAHEGGKKRERVVNGRGERRDYSHLDCRDWKYSRLGAVATSSGRLFRSTMMFGKFVGQNWQQAWDRKVDVYEGVFGPWLAGLVCLLLSMVISPWWNL